MIKKIGIISLVVIIFMSLSNNAVLVKGEIAEETLAGEVSETVAPEDNVVESGTTDVEEDAADEILENEAALTVDDKKSANEENAINEDILEISNDPVVVENDEDNVGQRTGEERPLKEQEETASDVDIKKEKDIEQTELTGDIEASEKETNNNEKEETDDLDSSVDKAPLKAQKLLVANRSIADIRNFAKKYPVKFVNSKWSENPVLSSPFKQGALNDATLQDALNAVNQVRYIAGLEPSAYLSDNYSDRMQRGCLLDALTNKAYNWHNPPKPDGVSNEMYNLGFWACQRSNLARQYHSLANTVILGWMGDTDEIESVGHRRWVLAADLKAIGIGAVNQWQGMCFGDASCTTFSNGAIPAWPAQTMPVEYFKNNFPWSISTGNTENSSKIKVTVKRTTSPQKTWTITEKNQSQGYFSVNNENYAMPGCIIFRPNDIGELKQGDQYSVTVEGTSKGTVSYNVNFFNLYERPITEIKITSNYTEIPVGSSKKFTAKTTPSNADEPVSWMTYYNNVRVSEDGTVEALNDESEYVWIYAENIKGDIYDSQQVRIYTPVKSVQLNKATATIVNGTTLQLKATISPSNATYKDLAWTSSNTAVATVDGSGKVTAKSAGTATITAKSNKEGKTATCKITIWRPTSTNSPVAGNYTKFINNTPINSQDTGKVKFPDIVKYVLKNESSVIPGLDYTLLIDSDGTNFGCSDMVPQGVCIAGDYMLISAYCYKEKHGSVIYLMKKDGGSSGYGYKYCKTLCLYGNGAPIISHFGGLAYYNNEILIADSHDSKNYKIWKLAYSDLVKFAKISDDAVIAKCSVKMANLSDKPSFINISEGELLIGEFIDKAALPTKLSVYDLNGERIKDPKSLKTNKGQGAATFICNKKRYLVISSAYGRNNTSELIINEYNQIKNTYTEKKRFSLPNMSEDLFITSDGKLYLVFESGANKYKDTSDKDTNAKKIRPLDRVVCIDINKLIEDLQVVAPTGVKLNKTSATMDTKKTLQLKATISPSNATNKAVTWTSSDKNIAIVDSNGKVTAVRRGMATITATSKANSKLKATCKITTRFYDVNDPSKYYYTPVYWAANKGIAGGYDNVYFGPQRNCTRREMTIFLWRLAGRPKAGGTINFKDCKYNKSSDTYKALLWASKKGIVNGYTSGKDKGKFKPDAPVSRKDTVIMLYRLAGKPKVSGTIKFPDVVKQNYKKNSDTYKAILWGTKKGITNGYSNGNFKPLDNCLREHIVTFIYRYAQKVK